MSRIQFYKYMDLMVIKYSYIWICEVLFLLIATQMLFNYIHPFFTWK